MSVALMDGLIFRLGQRQTGEFMKRLMRSIGTTLFALLSLFYVAFGVFYASVHDLLWFHAAAVPADALQAVRPLYFALMKLVGGAAAALGLLGLYVSLSSLRRGEGKAAIALAVAFAAPLIMAAYVAETLAATTGAPTSWRIMGGLLFIDAAAIATQLAGAARREAGRRSEAL